MTETPSDRYEVRTRRNALDSDGTLVLNAGALDGGTLLTVEICKGERKPRYLVQLDRADFAHEATRVREWLASNAIAVLNIAGPRESKRPGVYRRACEFLNTLCARTE